MYLLFKMNISINILFKSVFFLDAKMRLTVFFL